MVINLFQGGRPGQSDEIISHQLLDQYIGAGGNFIDTADVYQHGMSERIIGQYLVKRPELRSKLIIATKVGGLVGGATHVHTLMVQICGGLCKIWWVLSLCVFSAKMRASKLESATDPLACLAPL